MADELREINERLRNIELGQKCAAVGGKISEGVCFVGEKMAEKAPSVIQACKDGVCSTVEVAKKTVEEAKPAVKKAKPGRIILLLLLVLGAGLAIVYLLSPSSLDPFLAIFTGKQHHTITVVMARDSTQALIWNTASLGGAGAATAGAITIVAATGTVLTGGAALGIFGFILAGSTIATCGQGLQINTYTDIPIAALPNENKGESIFGLLTKTMTWQARVIDSQNNVVASLGGTGTYGCFGDAVLKWTQDVWVTPGSYTLLLKYADHTFNWDETGVASTKIDFIVN